MKMKNFGLLEAVETAITMEEEGVRFYAFASDRLEDPERKKLFAKLREMEDQHINTFRKLYSDIADRLGESDESLYLTDPEVSAYFRAFVESTVFPVKGAAEKVIARVKNVEDILRLGLQVEKDSIHFYRELTHHSPFPEAVEIIEKIIGEERKHFHMIHELCRNTTGGKPSVGP